MEITNEFISMPIEKRLILVSKVRSLRDEAAAIYYAPKEKAQRVFGKTDKRIQILKVISEEIYQSLRTLGLSDAKILQQIKKGVLT